MARHSPRSEVVIAVGLLAFIGIAIVKPWGSTTLPPDTKAGPTSVAVTTPSVEALLTPPPSPGEVWLIAATIPISTTPVGLIEAEGDLWFPTDRGHVTRLETGTSTTTEIGLDPTRFSGGVELAGDLVYLWVTGAEDHSVGVLDTASLEVSRIPAVTTEPMVIDKIHGASADSVYLWFLADVHASQEILGTPCCNGFTATMLYRADVASGTMSQIGQLARPVSIGVGFGSVWILSHPSDAAGPYIIERLDRETGAMLASVELPAAGPDGSPCGACISSFLVGSNSVWVPTGLANSLVRIDPTTGRVVTTIDLGRDVESAVETPDGYIWAVGGRRLGTPCDPTRGYISVIDASTNRIARDGHLACPVSLVVHDQGVWVGTDDPTGPLLQRIQPRQ